MKRYPALLGQLYNTPHVILPEKFDEIAAFLEAAGRKGDAGAAVAVEPPESYCQAASGERCAFDQMSSSAAGEAFVAVLPLFGTMFQHGSMEMRYSGGVSTEAFGREFDRLESNPAVKTIVIEVHSPGGQVFGTGELSDLIYQARERGDTRIVAAVNSMAASGALWVATAAKEVYVTPGGAMGSVGVLYAHQDISQWEAKAGVKTTLIATPQEKVRGNEFEPLDEETIAEIRSRQEKSLNRFVAGLARNRGLSDAAVRSDFGGGGMLRAEEAVTAKMADDVMTFRDVVSAEIERLRTGTPRGNAAANARAISLAEADGV